MLVYLICVAYEARLIVKRAKIIAWSCEQQVFLAFKRDFVSTFVRTQTISQTRVKHGLRRKVQNVAVFGQPHEAICKYVTLDQIHLHTAMSISYSPRPRNKEPHQNKLPPITLSVVGPILIIHQHTLTSLAVPKQHLPFILENQFRIQVNTFWLWFVC